MSLPHDVKVIIRKRRNITCVALDCADFMSVMPGGGAIPFEHFIRQVEDCYLCAEQAECRRLLGAACGQAQNTLTSHITKEPKGVNSPSGS